MNAFSQQKLDQIFRDIDVAVKEHQGQPLYAAFDADGTLWTHDVGEDFFDYQIDNKCVPLPDDPWTYYGTLKEKHPPTAYLWLAQINKDQPLDQVHAWARAASEKQKPFPVIEEQRKIIGHLKSCGVCVYIVTASVKWAVDPVAEQVGLDFENVIGITTKIEKGKVTDIQDGPITWREGKVRALLEKTSNTFPIFCSGNTMGDFPLLESSQAIRLAIRSAPISDTEMYPTETELMEKAIQLGWNFHSFSD